MNKYFFLSLIIISKYIFIVIVLCHIIINNMKGIYKNIIIFIILKVRLPQKKKFINKF